MVAQLLPSLAAICNDIIGGCHECNRSIKRYQISTFRTR